jgi:hypothetical protein
VALNIWNIPPKEKIVGAHPLTENFSQKMWEKAKEKRLDLHITTEEELNARSRMHVLRSDEMQELAVEAARSVSQPSLQKNISGSQLSATVGAHGSPRRC